jgi:hypothetical protein
MPENTPADKQPIVVNVNGKTLLDFASGVFFGYIGGYFLFWVIGLLFFAVFLFAITHFR